MIARTFVMASVLLGVGFAPAPVYRCLPGNKTDLERMQGDWTASTYYMAEKTKLEWREATGDTRVVVTGNQTLTFFQGGKERSKWVIRLDPTKKPAQIDMKETSTNWQLLGIYKWEGKRLVIAAGGGSRSANFDTALTPGGVLPFVTTLSPSKR